MNVCCWKPCGGIQALFVRRDEVEEAWKWVDSITRRGRWTMMC
ncbi:hypothetical protein ACNKHN_10570 [Shigella flexneri]